MADSWRDEESTGAKRRCGKVDVGSQEAHFGEGRDGVAYDVIEQSYVDQREGFFQPTRDHLVGLRRRRNPRGMLVGIMCP